MKMNKWKIKLIEHIAIVIVLVVCTGLGIWWFIDTNPTRKATAEYELLVDFANRQTVEIAIIKQASTLYQLKAAIRQAVDPNDGR